MKWVKRFVLSFPLIMIVLSVIASQLEDDKQMAAKEEKQRVGFHCVGRWDGSHQDVKRRTKQSMREPDSFEHISTKIAPVDEDGTHWLVMQFRARNGFGGTAKGFATARVRSSDCEVVKLSVNG